MLIRRGCRRALVAVVFLFALGRAARAQESSPAEPSVAPDPAVSAPHEPDPSGVFASDRGDEIRIVRSREDDRWVMAMKDVHGRASTYVLEGDAAALKPVGMQGSQTFGSASVDIVVDGGKMYGVAERDGRTLEFFSAGDGEPVQTAVNGRSSGAIPGSADESELRLVARDFGEKWAMTKRMTFSVTTNRFTACTPGSGNATGGSGAARASEFARSGDLSDDEAIALTGSAGDGRERMAASKAFAK